MRNAKCWSTNWDGLLPTDDGLDPMSTNEQPNGRALQDFKTPLRPQAQDDDDDDDGKDGDAEQPT